MECAEVFLFFRSLDDIFLARSMNLFKEFLLCDGLQKLEQQFSIKYSVAFMPLSKIIFVLKKLKSRNVMHEDLELLRTGAFLINDTTEESSSSFCILIHKTASNTHAAFERQIGINFISFCFRIWNSRYYNSFFVRNNIYYISGKYLFN